VTVRPGRRAYRDLNGELWLDPGGEDGALLALDDQAVATLRAEHGACHRATIEDKFGPLRELPDPRDLLPIQERYPLLLAADGRTPEESLDLVLRVTGRARDADDARDLLEMCGLRSYQKGTR
jgi:hypothetical protein